MATVDAVAAEAEQLVCQLGVSVVVTEELVKLVLRHSDRVPA